MNRALYDHLMGVAVREGFAEVVSTIGEVITGISRDGVQRLHDTVTQELDGRTNELPKPTATVTEP